MVKAVVLYLIFVAIIWFCVLTFGIGFGYMALILLIGVGAYLMNGGF